MDSGLYKIVWVFFLLLLVVGIYFFDVECCVLVDDVGCGLWVCIVFGDVVWVVCDEFVWYWMI